MRIDGSVALLTGSCRGIGEACALALSRRGARVVLHARSADTAAGAAADVGAKVVSADFRDDGAAERLAEEARDVYGRIDMVVHCAGIGWYGDVPAMDADRIDELLDVNLRAPVRLTRAVLPEMIDRGSGHIGFIGSIAGLTGVAHESVYSAAKSGLITFADSLRLELAGTGVGVSVISPAAVRTEFFAHRGTPYDRKLPRPVPPERVAHAVLRGVERGHANRTVPRWVGVAPVVRAAAPSVFHALSRRMG